MDDDGVLNHIHRLVDEEHHLENSRESGEPDQARLARINVELDQCWDLLRQRRARREYGGNPDEASVRSRETVEGYDPQADLPSVDE
ncbi:MAG TPA: DUF2630 family protein [Rhodanobacteraceae bacterium]|nr:DUF2630 family protein [Rhodanobacteraceae bacterium]